MNGLSLFYIFLLKKKRPYRPTRSIVVRVKIGIPKLCYVCVCVVSQHPFPVLFLFVACCGKYRAAVRT